MSRHGGDGSGGDGTRAQGMSLRRIGISLGDLHALDHGLGEFSVQIGRRIAALASAWAEQHRIGFDFHLRPELSGLFGTDVGYLPVRVEQRRAHVQPAPYALWHSLHQLNRNLPPRGCALRAVTVHDLNYLHDPSVSTYTRWQTHRRMRALVARTDAVFAISRSTASDVAARLAWRGPTHVVHNGARSFVESPRRPLPGWGETATRPFLFHLSRMAPSKNPQAIVELARVWPDMTFVMCGPRNEDSERVARSTLLPNVQFHLDIDDAQKAWAYGECAGLLFPSLTEGFGLPPIEAMHFGKPVFLARRGSLPEIGGDVACYFDGFEPNDMRRVVERGLVDANRPGVSGRMREHASQFSWDRAADAYAAHYLRLLAAGSATPAEAATVSTASSHPRSTTLRS